MGNNKSFLYKDPFLVNSFLTVFYHKNGNFTMQWSFIHNHDDIKCNSVHMESKVIQIYGDPDLGHFSAQHFCIFQISPSKYQLYYEIV